MGELVNRFSFSFSAWKAYSECRRRWWLEKIGSWQGWERDAPEDARLAYRCKNMGSLWALSGEVIHDLAAQLMHRRLITASDLQDRYRTTMRERMLGAKARAQGENPRPKRTPDLEEYYYGHEDLRPMAEKVLERGLRCLAAIFESSPYGDSLLPRPWFETEELHSFELEGVPVWIKVDLAYRDPGGMLWLWDWKTGRPKDEDLLQMLMYALWAQQELGTPPDRMRLGICYLLTGEESVTTPTEDDLLRMRELVQKASAAMGQNLQTEPMAGDPQLWPMTEDRSLCRQCRMYHPCKGDRDRR